jgi:Rad3-related DNA helicase
VQSDKSILDFYPFPTFRPGHREVLLFIQDYIRLYDTILIDAPTGAGKTAIRQTISRWYQNCVQSVPDNQLLYQERKNFPDTLAMFGKDCKYYNNGEYDYYEDKAAVLNAREKNLPTLVTSYSILAHRLMREMFIFDEGHKLLQLNADLSAKKLWRKKAGYPQNIYSRQQFEEWLRSDDAKAKLTEKGRKQWLEKITTNDYLVERSRGMLRGDAEDCIRLVPLSPGLHNAFKKDLKKLILMSATINEMDVAELKVGKGSRVATLRLPSGIPMDRRPLVRRYVSGSLNFHNLEAKCKEVAAELKAMADFHDTCLGLAHVTYQMIPFLLQHLRDDKRFIFHDKTNSGAKLREWQSHLGTGRAKIFIGAGFSEGLDLKGEGYGFQVICKVAWPSLADLAIKKRADRKEAWYIWQTLRDFLQRYGRICRGADDYGVTYILDSSFERLYELALRYGLWPKYIDNIE